MNSKDLKLLGVIFYSQEPHRARQMLNQVKTINKSKEYQFADIKQYFELYCVFFKLDSEFIINPKPEERRARNEYIRIFLAAMLKIYNPELYHLKKSENLPRGLLRQISKTTTKSIQALSQDARKVVVMSKTYSDFAGHMNNYLNFINRPID